MVYKKIKRSIEDFIGWLILCICSLIIKFIPQKGLYPFARDLGNLLYIALSRQRKIAFNSLSIAFGKEMAFPRVKRIAKDCFIYMAKTAIELMFFSDRPYLIKERVRIVNKEKLDKALSRGKGVILVSAHFGNFPLMLGRLSVEGYKTGVIMRPIKNPRASRLFEEKRRHVYVKNIYSIPRKECVENTLHSLRNNELVFIPLDQNFGTGGVFVDFFGVKAATATGPVVLAKRTGAAILPCFIIRRPDDTHEIIFEDPVELQEGNKEEDAIALNIQKITNIIEAYIRRYPAEWGWIHRRWKSRPTIKEGGV